MADVNVKIGGDVTPLERAMERARNNVKRFSAESQTSISKLKDGFGKLTATFGGLTAALGSLSVAFALVKNWIDEAGNIKDLSDRLDVTAQTVQKLQYLALKAGVDVGVLVKALEKGNRSALDAVQGNKQLAQSFDDLGISAKEYLSASPERQILMMTAALENSSDKTKAGAAALDILGQKAAALAPLYKQGADGVKKQMSEIGVATNEQIEAMDRWGSAVETAFENFRNAGMASLGAVILQFEKLLKFSNAVANSKGIRELISGSVAAGKVVARATLPGWKEGEGIGRWAGSQVAKGDVSDTSQANPFAGADESADSGKPGEKSTADKNAIAKAKAAEEFARNIRKGREEVRKLNEESNKDFSDQNSLTKNKAREGFMSRIRAAATARIEEEKNRRADLEKERDEIGLDLRKTAFNQTFTAGVSELARIGGGGGVGTQNTEADQLKALRENSSRLKSIESELKTLNSKTGAI